MAAKAELFDLLSSLVLTPAVSGNEAPLREVITQQLAQGGIDAGRLKRDELGNCWLTCGPAHDTERLLVAWCGSAIELG
jgi:putative aminopeptidase FrvX